VRVKAVRYTWPDTVAAVCSTFTYGAEEENATRLLHYTDRQSYSLNTHLCALTLLPKKARILQRLTYTFFSLEDKDEGGGMVVVVVEQGQG